MTAKDSDMKEVTVLGFFMPVDNLIVAGNDGEVIFKLESYPAFKMKELGPLRFSLRETAIHFF